MKRRRAIRASESFLSANVFIIRIPYTQSPGKLKDQRSALATSWHIFPSQTHCVKAHGPRTGTTKAFLNSWTHRVDQHLSFESVPLMPWLSAKRRTSQHIQRTTDKCYQSIYNINVHDIRCRSSPNTPLQLSTHHRWTNFNLPSSFLHSTSIVLPLQL